MAKNYTLQSSRQGCCYGGSAVPAKDEDPWLRSELTTCSGDAQEQALPE